MNRSNDIKIYSISVKMVVAIGIMMFLFGCERNREYDFKVEGLNYLDNKPVEIEIKDGRISGIKKIKRLQDEANSLIIAPGLIDNQVNGYMGYSFVNTGKELSLEGVKDLTNAFWEVGITTFMPTLTTNDHNIFLRNFEILAKAKEDTATRGSIAGFHLEGPYISPVDGYRGAHPLIHVRKPDWDEFMELYKASGENILQVTLAPETEGAMDFISKCRELVKLINPSLSVTQCSLPADNHFYSSFARGFDNWEKIAFNPNYDVFSTSILVDENDPLTAHRDLAKNNSFSGQTKQ